MKLDDNKRDREKYPWWKRGVFYQIYPRSYKDSNGDGVGDLPGIESVLGYLNNGTEKSLGIDAIWFSPFFTSPDRDYGYDVSDYCAIDPRYGTLDDFKALLKSAHERNIRVLLDLVVNHSSDQHPWFVESRSSRNNPRRDWYIWKDGRQPGNKPPNNWRNHFFGSAWTWDEKTEQYYLHSFLKEQPDLNWHNSQVREAIADVIKYWLDLGVDGFRLDVPHVYCKDKQFRNNPPFYSLNRNIDFSLFKDRSFMSNLLKLLALPELQFKKYNQHQSETHSVLRGFRKVLDSYQDKVSVGEIIADSLPVIVSYYGRENDQLHMNFYFELLHCRWKAHAFRRCIQRWENALPEEAWPVYTFSNHDVNRAFSRYDQRGRGDKRARMLALMLLTLRGTPFIYYGEEIGMKEGLIQREQLKDPLGIKWYPFHRGRDGCRTPMQWDEGIFAGFSSHQPWLPLSPEHEIRNVRVQDEQSESLLNFFRQLIWLRKKLPLIVEGDYQTYKGRLPSGCYIYLRQQGDKKIAVALNFGKRKKKLEQLFNAGSVKLLISTCPTREPGVIAFPFTLKGEEGCLLELSP